MNIYALRLLNVARATREAIQTFDMDHFAHPCGTPACAFGNYAARADLQDDFALAKVHESSGDHPWWPVHLESGNQDGCDSVDARSHFGLTPREMWALFGPNGCGDARNDALAAAQYIEWFVSEKWPLDPAIVKLRAELETIVPRTLIAVAEPA